MRPKVRLVYIDSGGGTTPPPRRSVIREQQRPWDLELVSLQDAFEPIDFIPRYTGIRMQDVYNIMLRRG